MANNHNLTPWKPGNSGNPKGKPKGSRHLSSCIQEMMSDENFITRYSKDSTLTGAPIEVIVGVLIGRALQGDYKAFELLAKFGYGTRVEFTTADRPMIIPILGGLSKKVS